MKGLQFICSAHFPTNTSFDKVCTWFAEHYWEEPTGEVTVHETKIAEPQIIIEFSMSEKRSRYEVRTRVNPADGNWHFYKHPLPAAEEICS